MRVTVTSQGIEELYLVMPADTSQHLVFPPFDGFLTSFDHSHGTRVPDEIVEMPVAAAGDKFRCTLENARPGNP
ncbi:hypothetical protein [Streptomyces kronopolitis]|uniref:hypothetical protein n=1 Tax=Streptomyces kronopolitis TaxID=1612435 RepID=UPI001E2E704B|nr:hypothetical protein [Streptomyces kronopolitis]